MNFAAGRRIVVALLGVAICAACSELPSSGPTADQITDGAERDNILGFKIVDVTPSVLEILARQPAGQAAAAPDNGKPPATDRVGPGDVLSVTVFESGGGVFSGRAEDTMQLAGVKTGATGETLPGLVVNREGNITVPYAGSIHAAGKRPSQIALEIEGRLRDQSLSPQVLVEVLHNIANTVMVSGDIKSPGRLPLTLAQERLSDMIALAGGATHPAQDTIVKVTRGERLIEMRLDGLDALSPENIMLAPGDRIQLVFEPRSYTVFGATAKVSQLPFESTRLTMAEGLARSGGANDSLADPRGIYLFRLENPPAAQELGLADAAPAPVMYHFNLIDPDSYFMMQQFAMRDKDLIYIANAESNNLQKLLILLNLLLTPAAAVSNVGP